MSVAHVRVMQADASLLSSIIMVQDLLIESQRPRSHPVHVVGVVRGPQTVKVANYMVKDLAQGTMTAELLQPDELVSGLMAQVHPHFRLLAALLTYLLTRSLTRSLTHLLTRLLVDLARTASTLCVASIPAKFEVWVSGYNTAIAKVSLPRILSSTMLHNCLRLRHRLHRLFGPHCFKGCQGTLVPSQAVYGCRKEKFQHSSKRKICVSVGDV